MNDARKTDAGKNKAQLLRELDELRQREASGVAAPATDNATCTDLAAVNLLLQQQIDERRQAAEAALQSQLQWERTFDAVPEMIAILDQKHQILRVNRALAERLGVERSQCVGRPCYEAIHGTQGPPAICPHALTLLDGHAHAAELHEDRLHGDFVVTTTPLGDEQGRTVGSVHVVRDVTEQKRAAEALGQSHEQLRTICEEMVEGLLITDIETQRFVRVNASLCRMLGYSEEELLAASLTDIHPPAEAANDVARFQAAAAGRCTVNEQRPVLRKDGSIFYADISGRAIRYDGRPCLLALFRDVTERKQAQEALARERRTLEHLLRSSDHERQLIAYEIHDGLAQQLAGAIMQLDVYEHIKEHRPREAAKAYEAGMTMLHQAHFETRRLISGVRPPILDEAGVVTAVAHLINEHRRQRGPKIEFHSKVEFGRLIPILENAIYRIVQEGLANACRHSKSKRVYVELVQNGDRLRLAIHDWGQGFEVAQCSSESFGLEGIRERTRLLGGEAHIESTPQHGTRITVDLPILTREMEP